MCYLTVPVPGESFIGYKLAAKDKEGKRWSMVMGFCYDDYEMVPIPKEQKKLCNDFIDGILDQDFDAFEVDMVGRTAVFEKLRDARAELSTHGGTEPLGYTFKIYKAKVSGDLMKGSYGSSPVVAGRKIEFLEEVNDV